MQKSLLVGRAITTYHGSMLDTEYHYTESPGLELILSGGAERRYPRHLHTDHWTIGMICSGTATLGTRNGTDTLRAGECFSVRPHAVHWLSAAPETVLAILCFESGESPPTALSALFDNPGILKVRESLEDAVSPRNINRLKEFGLRFADREKRSTTDPFGVENPIQAVFQLLIQKPEEAFSIEKMAAFAGYSRRHFLRRFQEEIGMTPHSFQLVCKLRHLRSLLRRHVPAAEAAVSVGFADQSHMHKVFKRHHGMTPRQFQQAGFKVRP